ncbi:hypothetical protein PA08_1695 [Cutibacterium modestum P08]|nr:hypothetical protein PA08_1695 [Cutibacterium modestum P08]
MYVGPRCPAIIVALWGDSTMTRLLVGDIPAFSVDVMWTAGPPEVDSPRPNVAAPSPVVARQP